MAESAQVIRRVWTSEVAPHIATAAGEDMAAILREVDAGIAEAYAMPGAHFITRVEGSELVVVCFEGKGLRPAAAFIVERARAAGLKSIRFHTRRRGIEKMVRGLGFAEVERVYRAVI